MVRPLNIQDNPLLMKAVFNCTVLYYNTPVFYKVTRIDDNEYFAKALDENLISFKLKKRYGQWYGESETSHYLAIQIGKQIDKSIASSTNGDNSN